MNFWPILLLPVSMGAFVFGAEFTMDARDGVWKRGAIEHHYAHYDSTTGVFKWNDEGADPTQGK